MLWVVLGLVGLYVAYGAAMVSMHRTFLYPFFQAPFDAPGFVRAQVDVPGAEPLPVYVVDAGQGAPVVLYFMGNAGSLDLFRAMLDHHRNQGRSVVAMTYRGGGGVPGAPSEAVLKRDALAVFDALPELVPDSPILLHGYSLGTGLALHVAANRDAEGVILSAPYARLCALMAEASWLPACMLPVDRWDSAAYTSRIEEPVLHLHGTRDALVPVQQGVELAARFGDGAEQLLIEGAGHTDLMSYPEYLTAIDAFINKTTGR